MDHKLGQISGIFIKKSKESLREEISGGILRENFGLDGDINSGEGPRQVCLLRKEDRERVKEDRREGLCFDRFRETLQTEGVPLKYYDKGNTLTMGHALLKVTVQGKKCWPECKIIQSGDVCALAATVRFLEVLKTGEIRKKDAVSLLPPP